MLEFAALTLLAGLHWFGLGALVSWLVARRDASRYPTRLLWPAIGLALSASLTLGLSLLGLTAPLLPALLLALSALGLVLTFGRWVGDRRTALAGVLSTAPVLVAFGATFAIYGLTITGYLADTSTGVHSLGADWFLHTGGPTSNATGEESAGAMIRRYFVVSAYPGGSHAELGLMSTFLGASVLRVNSAFMGLCLAVTAPAAVAIVRGLGGTRVVALAGGVVASTGALTMNYALTGEIKEIAALPLVAAASAIAVSRDAARGPMRAVVAAILAAGLYSMLGPSGLAWGAPLLLFVVLGISRARRGAHQPEPGAEAGKDEPVADASADGEPPVPRRGRSAVTWGRDTVVRGLLAAGVLLLVLAPQLPALADQLAQAQTLSQTNVILAADPGNLTGPIPKIRALGTYLAPDHRAAASFPTATVMAQGILALMAGLAVVALLLRRRWGAVAWVGLYVALWVLLTQRGTMWIDAKLVVLAGPLMSALVVLGAGAIARGMAGRRTLVGTALAVVLLAVPVGGALASSGLLFRATTIADMGMYDELGAIDERFEGRGPALLTEFDEYALYSLRDVGLVAPGFIEVGSLSRQRLDGTSVGYGQSVDVDDLPTGELERFPLVVTRISPLRSAPPSNYAEVFRGRYFVVYERKAPAQAVQHDPVGADVAVGALSCTDARTDLRRAAAAGRDAVARTAPAASLLLPFEASGATPNWAATFPGITGDGRLVADVPAGARSRSWDAWIEGAVGRALDVYAQVDGAWQPIGRIDRSVAGDGNVAGPVRVPPRAVRLRFDSTAATLEPGDRAPTVFRSLVLSAPEQPQVRRAPATTEGVDGLCREEGVDWLDTWPRGADVPALRPTR